MKIFFLTNNFTVTKPLFDWLAEIGEVIFPCEDKINADFVIENNISFIVSYNYLHIIKEDVINLLPHRVINLHTSFLPWNRGYAPNIWSFINNTPCGVTIHEVDKGLDTGDILMQKQMYFDYSNETLRSSYDKLHIEIQALFKANWYKLLNCEILPQKQTGQGSFHYKKDLGPCKDIFNYDDTIHTFMHKIINIQLLPEIVIFVILMRFYSLKSTLQVGVLDG